MNLVSSSLFAIETIKIVPPNLDIDHLGQEILCHRPMRNGSPNLGIETTQDKIIANNYGHGGSGWTLGPGSSAYVVNQLMQKMQENKESPKADTPMAVIGAGALGLFSAAELYNQGFRNITVIADRFEDLTSHRAGGLLAPVSMDNDKVMQQLINKIGIEAYKFYEKISKGKHPFLKGGARIVPAYFESREDSGLEPYVNIVMSPAKDVILDFGNGTTRKMVQYPDGIFIDTGYLMVELTRFLGSKVKFEKRFVRSFSEVRQKYIVNCTGLGSKNLNRDEKMISVQGHLVLLKKQNPAELDYMILVYFGKHSTRSGFPVKRSFYIFPKRMPGTALADVGVIGGTFIEGADAEHPNSEEFQILIDGARRFYGLLK